MLCSAPAAVERVHHTDAHWETWVPGIMQLSCLPGSGTMTVDFASFGDPDIGSNGSFVRGREPTADYAAFQRTDCDARPAVLTRLKELCDGKQSCMINTTDPVFHPASMPAVPRCNNDDAGDPIMLAVRATGCALGTGGGGNIWFRESLTAFLLTRGDHAWFGFGWIATQPLVWYPEWDVDYGVPLGPMTIDGNVASQNWTKISVALDLESFEATFQTAWRD